MEKRDPPDDLAPSRRDVLRALGAAAGVSILRPWRVLASPWSGSGSGAIGTRAIPSSGEALPPVGLGSWITFNVGDDAAARDSCADVMRAFFAGGGRMIDSSPMYGSSQAVIGYGLKKLDEPRQLF